MTQSNSASDNNTPSTPAPARKRRRGLWWKIPLVLIVLLVLLVLLAPTIASTSPVRNMVLSKVNASLPGKLEVADWSLGWFTGTNLKGISWTDATGKKVATVSEVQTPVTLAQLARGDLHVGQIVIPEVNVDLVVPVAQPEAKRPTAANEQPPHPSQPQKPQPQAHAALATTINLPDVAGSIKVEHVTGQVTFVDAIKRTSAVIQLDKSTSLTANMPGGNAATGCDAVVGVLQPSGVGTTTVNATVNGLHAGTVDLNTLTGNATVKLQGLDLDQAAAIARVYGTPLGLGGLLGGQLDITSTAPGQFAAKGELGAGNVSIISGKDQFKSSKLQIPVDATYALAQQHASIRQLAVILDQGQINVTGELPVAGLKEMQQGIPVTDEGTVNVKADFPSLPAIVNSLPNTVKLQQGVQLTGGRLAANVEAAITKEGLRVRAPVSLIDLSGTREGQKIGPLQPLNVDAAVRMPSLANAMDARDINVNVTSSFLNLTAKGPTIPQTVVNASADIATLKQDFGQLVDLSMLRSGKATINVVNRSRQTDTLEPDAQIQVSNLSLDLPATQGQPSKRLENGTLFVSAHATYSNNAKTVQLNQPARVELSGRLLQLVQGQPPVVLYDQPTQVVVNGSANLGADPRKLELTQLLATVGNNNAPIAQVAMAGNAPTELTLTGKRDVVGTIPLTIQADLVNAMGIAQRFSAATQPAVPNLRTGIFRGNLNVTIAQNGDLSVALADSTTDLTLAGAGQQYRDRISTTLHATIPADNSKLQADADIRSSAFQVTVPQTLVVLPTATQQGGVFDMVPNAQAKVVVSDVAKATALANAFAPGKVPALTGGPVNADVSTSREKDVTSFNVTANTGELRYADKANAAPIQPMKVAVKGELQTDPSQKQMVDQLKQLRVDQLDAQTDIAQVSLPQPIVISNIPAVMSALKGAELPADTKVEGQVRVVSNIGKLMALSGKQSAYTLDGSLTSDQKLSLQGRDIVAQLNTVVNDLKVSQGGKQVVQESKLTLAGGVRIATQQGAIQVDNLAMTSADGLCDMKLTGRISDLGKQNKIENMRLDLTPDLAKVWPIVYATMTPEQQAKIGQLAVTGKQTDTITASGSYPMGKPYNEAIKSLLVTGNVGFDSVNYQKYGVVLGTGVIPFTLENGIARTMYKTDQGYKAANPIPCNNGTLDLSNIVADMTGDAIRVSMPANKKLITGVQLNNVMAASLGQYVSFLFGESDTAKGSADVTVVKCDNLPLGEKLYDPRDPGYAEFLISANDLNITSSRIGSFLSLIGLGQGNNAITGGMKDARIIIAQGKCVQQNVNLQLAGLNLGFNGEMVLATNYFNTLQVSVPGSALGNLVRSNELTKYLPDRVALDFTGPANSLKLNPNTVTNLAQQAVQKQVQSGVLGGLTGGNKQGAGSQNQQPANVVGGILQGVLGGQQNQQGNQQQQPSQTTQPQQQNSVQNQQQQPANAVGGLLNDLLNKPKKEKSKK